MLETLSRKQVKAKKEHYCSYCGGKINKGEVYEVSNIKNDGDFYAWKEHLKCSKLTSELDMFANLWGEGLDSDEFMGNIKEFLSNNMSEEECEELDLYGEDAVDKAIEILKIKEAQNETRS